jgi:hypothetical protein
MSKLSLFKRISNTINMIGSAIEVSAAVEGRRTPKAAQLRELGIDPASFANIRHF